MHTQRSNRQKKRVNERRKRVLIKSIPVPAVELPPEDVKEDAELPTGSQLDLLIANLPYALGTARYWSKATCTK